ncbi:putative sensor domain DACNV-containing protein [Pontibacter saemangeumensis]
MTSQTVTPAHLTKYQTAITIVETVESHYTRHIATARRSGDKRQAVQPHAQAIEGIIDAAFWTSLRREEGFSPRISLAFLPPEQAVQPVRFGQRLKLSTNNLKKLAPGVERPGIHLGVWYEQDELYVWGTTRHLPNFCFVVDVSEPGMLVVKHKRKEGLVKFKNMAVLVGEQVKVIDESSTHLTECPALLTSLLGLGSSSSWDEPVNALVQLALSMRAHRHGGTLLIVPAGTAAWQASMVHPILHLIEPPFFGLSDLMKQDEREKVTPEWQGALREAIDSIASFTAVDGATIITDQYELIAFGAKITRPVGRAPVEQMMVTEPVLGSEPCIVHPTQKGGTRHLSAAQFVQDQQDAIALVASQDGRFTAFAWSPCTKMVQAHQIDTLLL